jgi:hypothetical protein
MPLGSTVPPLNERRRKVTVRQQRLKRETIKVPEGHESNWEVGNRPKEVARSHQVEDRLSELQKAE